MKKLLFAAVAIIIGVTVLGSVAPEGQISRIGEIVEGNNDKTSDEIKAEIASQVKDQVTAQIKSQLDSFWKNDDLQESLGITEEQQQEVEDSVREYANNYDLNTDQAKELTQNIINTINDSKGISWDDVKEKIDITIKSYKE